MKAERRHIPLKLTTCLYGAFNSRRHGEELPANSAFTKCWKCAEAREKLIEQVKRLKIKQATQFT